MPVLLWMGAMRTRPQVWSEPEKNICSAFCRGGGYGRLEIDGREYRLKRGDVFLISPETEAWYEADQKDPWFYSWVGFCGVKAKECMDNAGLSSKKASMQD